MFQRLLLAGLCILFLATPNLVDAQFSRRGLVSRSAANRYGLTRKWNTQIQVDRARGRVSFVSQHVNSTSMQTIYQVIYDGGKVEFSERGFDRFGRPLGHHGAIRESVEQIRRIIRQLRQDNPDGLDDAALTKTMEAADQVIEALNTAQENLAEPTPAADAALPDAEEEDAETDSEPNFETIVAPLLQTAVAQPDALPKLARIVVPDITIYASTDQGIVHAVDGETGVTRWSMRVGRPNHPNLGPVANDDYVAVVNGSKLYLLTADTGTLVWQRWLKKGAPGATPAMTEESIYVPMLDGRIEVYPVELPKDQKYLPSPKAIFAAGRGLVQPTVTPDSLGWPTDRGFFLCRRCRSAVRPLSVGGEGDDCIPSDLRTDLRPVPDRFD